jgi:hypothetical protein
MVKDAAVGAGVGGLLGFLVGAAVFPEWESCSPPHRRQGNVGHTLVHHQPWTAGEATGIRDSETLGNRKHSYWSLDVTFGEDSRRQQDRNGAANLAAVRRLALNLLRQEKSNKRGLKNKRLACALDPNYLLAVLASAQF